MKKNRRMLSRRVVVLLISLTAGLLLFAFTPVGFFMYFVVIGPIQDARLQKRLLCETNHQALLEECRRLSNRVVIDNPDRGKEEPMGVVVMRVPDSELSKFRLIRDTGGRVFVNIDGVISIEGGGTMRHFGLNAYPENFREPFSNYDYGHKELVPGLWYYDDTYKRDKDYGKVIDGVLRGRRK
jgi:hypothetical protein